MKKSINIAKAVVSSRLDSCLKVSCSTEGFQVVDSQGSLNREQLSQLACLGAREIVQRSRAPTVLTEDQVLILATICGVQPSVTHSSRSDTLLWPLQVPGVHIVYIHTCRQALTHMKSNKPIFF